MYRLVGELVLLVRVVVNQMKDPNSEVVVCFFRVVQNAWKDAREVEVVVDLHDDVD